MGFPINRSTPKILLGELLGGFVQVFLGICSWLLDDDPNMIFAWGLGIILLLLEFLTNLLWVAILGIFCSG